MSADERVAEWLANEIPEADTAIGRAWQKVRDFVDRLVNAFGIQTAHGVVRNIRSGEIFEREPAAQDGEAGERYAVGQKLREADIPVDAAEPIRLDTKGRYSDVTARAAHVFRTWPKTIVAADGSTIVLKNPEGGLVSARVKHLIWDNDKNILHAKKAEWLPSVPETLRNAAVRIVDQRSGNRIYVRQYVDGTKHMVVVSPDGIVEEQRPFKGWLITQFPYAGEGHQDSMVIDWERGKGEGNLQEGPNPSRTASLSLGSEQLVNGLGRSQENPNPTPPVSAVPGPRQEEFQKNNIAGLENVKPKDQYRLAQPNASPSPEEKGVSASKLTAFIQDETNAIIKTILSKTPANIHHMSMLEKFLKSPEWYSHPVMQRIVRLFMRDRNELYHQYFIHLASTHEVTREDETVMDLAKQLKYKGLTRMQILKGETSKEYKDLMWIIDYGDTEYVRNHRKSLANQIKEFEEEIRREGVSEDAIRVWKYYRQSYDAALDMMTAQMKEMVAAIEEEAAFRGMKAADYSEMYSTLKGALATMNRWRGFYAPRIRQGNWAVLAYRGEGAEREYYREHRWSEMSARRLSNKLKREGWNIRSVSEIERLPEDIYQDIKTIDTAKAIESALDKMTRGEAGEGRMATTLKFNEELLQEVADMIRARGFRSSMIHRKPGDRVTRGYIEDPMERHGIYTSNLARGFAKAKVAQAAYNELMGTYIKGHKTENGGYVKGRIFGGIDPKKEPRVYSAAKDYIEEQLRNLDRADRIVGLAKSIATLKFLGFSVRSALVNMTAMITTVPPSIHQYVMDSKGSMMKIHRELGKAGKNYAKIMATGKLPEGDEGRFLLEQHRLGWDDPQYTRDAMSNMTKLHNRAWELTMEGAMWMFGKTEQWNRGATMLAAYRIARKQGKNHEEAAELAKTASDKAHGVYGRATLPAVAWGRNPAAKVAQMLYVYGKFSHNYLQSPVPG